MEDIKQYNELADLLQKERERRIRAETRLEDLIFSINLICSEINKWHAMDAIDCTLEKDDHKD